MASCWGLIVAVFALNVCFSEAQNATVTIIPSATTNVVELPVATSTSAIGGGGGVVVTNTQIVATPATAVVPISSASPTSPTDNFTISATAYLSASFNTSSCPSEIEALINSTLRSFLADPKFDLKAITFDVNRVSCQFKFNATFGPNRTMYDITEAIEKKLMSFKQIKLTDIKFRFDDVTLGQFKPKRDDCEKKCCDGGAGGPITVHRTCTPSNKCGNFKLKKEVGKCLLACSHICSPDSGETMCKISLLVLLFGVFVNWLV